MGSAAVVLFACMGWSVVMPAGVPDVPRAPSEQIDRILTQLEQRGDQIKDFRGKIVFTEEDRINLSKRTSYGSILFLMTEANPRFLIHFERSESDGLLGKQEWYLFDGRWLHQGIERIQQVTQQEIVRAGETYDPFDLESAPFPLPFGQKKEKILASFHVTLLPPAPGDPSNTDHIRCVPKEGSRAQGKYDRLEFFIQKELHLPSRIVITKSDGLETSRADFIDLSSESLNTGIREKDFDRPKAWRKYKVIVEKLPPPG